MVICLVVATFAAMDPDMVPKIKLAGAHGFEKPTKNNEPGNNFSHHAKDHSPRPFPAQVHPP
jgi:hypothetical protein